MGQGDTTEKLSRKERERLAHRREILAAAERVFVRKGYHGATVEEIAREAEFAVGTLYNFFKGKDDMYEEVVADLMSDYFARFEGRVLSQDDPVAAIGALVELRLTHFDEHRGFARVFLETMPGGRLGMTGAVPERCAGMPDRHMELVSGIFARGIEAGVFEPVDPLDLVLCLDGIINAFVAYWARREPTAPLGERIGKMTELILNRIMVRRPRDGEPAGEESDR